MADHLARLEAGLGSILISGVGRTIRFREENAEFSRRRVLNENRGVIFSFWHNRLYFLSYYLSSRFLWNGREMATLISRSEDGAKIARVIERFGGTVVRGSTSRGGRESLRKLMRLAEQAHTLVITPDGPRGPKYEVQQGVAFLSVATGLPLVPLSYGVSDCIRLGSWDEFIVPYPFAGGTVLYGDPIWPKGRGRKETDRIQNELQAEMDRLEKGIAEMGYEHS